MKRILLTWLSSVALALPLCGQVFTNVDFESARVVVATNFGAVRLISPTNALPGWSASASLIQYNLNAGGIPGPIALLASNSDVIVGNFSVLLNYGSSISQTGLVPGGARSLLFDATTSSLLVSLGGQSLSYTVISNVLNSFGKSYIVCGADISSFVGQTETLTFLSPNTATYTILDNIQFSTISVPEPSAISFLCLGSGILFYFRGRKR